VKTRFLPFVGCLGLVNLAGSAVHADEPDAAAPAAKTHVLYMGADLSIQQGKKYYRVEDVDGSEFVITVRGKPQFIRTRLQTNHLKVDPGLKLAPFSVRLDELQGGPGYTPAADPRHKFNARSGAASGATAARDMASANVAEITDTLSKIDRTVEPFRTSLLETELAKQQDNLGGADYQLGTDYGSVGTMANALALELAEGNFDLVDVSFKISSPEPLDDPYMVVLVEFQPRGAKPGDNSLLIHAKALDPIGPEPKYIRIREGGMPVGFKYLRHEVHIYNRGREVATNVSSRRVELSRDEAREYLLIEYLGSNKDATVPAAAVAGSLPASVRGRVSAEQLNRTCYARIAKDGRLTGLFADEAASLPIADADFAGLFADALYKPALAQGKPMDGVVRVKLADLIL
jgi:hypothetical protein